MFVENREIMAKNINKYLEQKGVTAKQMCEDLGFAPASVSDWRHGRTYPRIDKIEMMANYFHCSKADLVEEQKEIPDYVPGTVEIIDLYSKATPEQRQAVLNLLRSFVPDQE